MREATSNDGELNPETQNKWTLVLLRGVQETGEIKQLGLREEVVGIWWCGMEEKGECGQVYDGDDVDVALRRI